MFITNVYIKKYKFCLSANSFYLKYLKLAE